MITKREILDYEVRSTTWAAYISWEWLQDIAAKYFAWKVNLKFDRYETSMKIRDKINRDRLLLGEPEI